MTLDFETCLTGEQLAVAIAIPLLQDIRLVFETWTQMGSLALRSTLDEYVHS